MKKFLRLACLLFAMLMMFSTVLAEGATRPVEEDTSNYTEIGTYAPLCNEPEKLTVMLPITASVEDITTNTFSVDLGASTNVEVTWIGIPEAAWTEQRNLMMADGNYPDIIISSGSAGYWSNADIAKYADEGILLPLNYYIENCMPGYQSFLATRGNLLEQTVSPDGNIYALAGSNNCFHAYAGNYKAFISKSYLEKVGGANPTTTDELYDLLVKFRDSGEGVVPLTGLSGAVRTWLVNAFIYDGINNCHCYVDDGKVACAYTTEQYREALRFIKKLFDEKLIDQTFLTLGASDIKALTERDGGNLVGMQIANTNNIYCTAGSDAYYDFMNMCAPIAGPEGVRTCYWNYENHEYNVAAIFSTCKKPELAARWLDNFYANWELCFNSRFGAQGVKWDWCKEGEKALDGSQAIWKKLTGLSIDTLQNSYWGSNGINGAFEHTTQANDAVGMEGFLYAGVQEYAACKPDYSMYLPTHLWLDADDSADLAQYETDLNNYMNNSFASFIKGTMDLDKDWDSYVAELDKIGLNEYMGLLQKALDKTR